MPTVAVHTPPRWMRSSQNPKMVLLTAVVGSGLLMCCQVVVGNDSRPFELISTLVNDAP
ncbi:MAG: hypothetical protein U0325_27465 [Polyangiales bacterium]